MINHMDVFKGKCAACGAETENCLTLEVSSFANANKKGKQKRRGLAYSLFHCCDNCQSDLATVLYHAGIQVANECGVTTHYGNVAEHVKEASDRIAERKIAAFAARKEVPA